MPNSDQQEKWRRSDEQIRSSLPRGIKLLFTLRGHQGAIGRIAWSPDGRMLASPSEDNTIRLWDSQTGECLHTLRYHSKPITCVSFGADGKMLVSCSQDKTIKLWDLGTEEILNVWKIHEGTPDSIVCLRSGFILITNEDGSNKLFWPGKADPITSWDGKFDGAARFTASPVDDVIVAVNANHSLRAITKKDGRDDWWLGKGDGADSFFLGVTDKYVDAWRAESKATTSTSKNLIYQIKQQLVLSGIGSASPNLDKTGTEMTSSANEDSLRSALIKLKGKKNYIAEITFSPDGLILASGAGDNLVKIWDSSNGKLLKTLEGHTSAILGLTIDSTSSLLASSSGFPSSEVRLWQIHTGAYLGKLPSLVTTFSSSGIAFHPRLPLLATVASEVEGVTETDQNIRIWKIDSTPLIQHAVESMVTYTSAKIVLVGESNVGKSYLAHRIATGLRPDESSIKSTHGMRFWPVAPERLTPSYAVCAQEKREIVLWDMGGQEEYRLIHQLFLNDTTIALVLFDPTRGATAFKEVEAWNKSLEKHLEGLGAVKLLVGSKLDEPSSLIDRQRIDRLVAECGFVGYFETSAVTGRGVLELCETISEAINWDGLGSTSRPELFQQIRDKIEEHRKDGEVVLHVPDLLQSVGIQSSDTSIPENLTLSIQETQQYLIKRALDRISGSQELKAVAAVTEQLAAQGLIARSRYSTGEPVLVLQVQEIERYAGSLILAARNNPRGVPALELRSVAEGRLNLPGIAENERLPREQEKPVVDCTVQLMLEHGICFEHEGLLIFPTLFSSAAGESDITSSHAISLYYDFAGAIDNIYASLIAWLVLAQGFGRVRLWNDRAEFEMGAGGLCGLRKTVKAGGFAHMDVYFGLTTPENERKEFISFVADHLLKNGVQIREHVAITCKCGHVFEEDTLRRRIVRGQGDVVCPVCEIRHSLTRGDDDSLNPDPKISKRTWALLTRVEERREKVTQQVAHVFHESEAPANVDSGPIRLLHLSDLHFTKDTPISARLQWLIDDIKTKDGMCFNKLDYLVISGDFTEKGCAEGFEKAYEFVSGLTQEFGLSAERCVFVPGNHDLQDLREAYEWRETPNGLKDSEWVKQGTIILARNPDKYYLRLKLFSDAFYHKFIQRPYPLEYPSQGVSIPFFDNSVQFLAFNSSWQIDQFHRKRSSINSEAVALAVNRAQAQEKEAQRIGQLPAGKPLLRIAVWHHAVSGPDQMIETDFIGNLQKNGVVLGLHGDVHEMRRELIGFRHEQKVHIVGAGSFGARSESRPEAIPRLYNIIEIRRDLKSARVHTRCQPRPDGPWDGWHHWMDPDGGRGRVPYYEIKW